MLRTGNGKGSLDGYSIYRQEGSKSINEMWQSSTRRKATKKKHANVDTVYIPGIETRDKIYRRKKTVFIAAMNKEKSRASNQSSGSNFRASPAEEPLPPFTTDSLKAADDLAAHSSCLSLSQPTVPVPALNPSGAFFAPFFFAAQLGDQFARGP